MCAAILLAEDDPRQAEILQRYLTGAGHRVTVAGDGQSALTLARAGRPDLIVLDVMMPTVDGLTVCGVLRAESPVMILMLTARDSEDDLLRGLDRGADDYLTKPYSPRELLARVRTLLRRVEHTGSARTEVLRIGRLSVDPHRHTVAVGDRPVDCTPAEFAILAAMAAQPGRVFTRRQLLEQTRAVDRDSTDRAVDSHVLHLRRKIETDPRRPEHLQTVYGVGYKLRDAGD
ncbi:response regulator transcription factor [Actinoplanes couchii]|uniref:DNA-binding response regulator n=1 Tax=Actinoplanes couchii TaxID=403638 RepID=A0ABQ3XEJ6_9ACTN|nr:response regulator transcription factor [Actinoplanes couchii]MDR6319802.1 DNA-binding response OmpR family regulator [Actinoplanes couchii]GID56937.1 DNA-binding response regulator [Actinoplanes couchii]